MYTSRLLAIGFVILLGIQDSGAQRFAWPEIPQNLQVLDEPITSRELSSIMRGFTSALGVRCSFCHAGLEGDPLADFDFASDENAIKETAREMMRMVNQINDKHLLDMEITGVQVTCVTCHNGKPSPRQLFELVDESLERKGVNGAVEKFRSLRIRHFGSSAYNFSERATDRYARILEARGDSKSALVFFQLNVEYFPESSDAMASLGNHYASHDDALMARIYLERAIILNPDNRSARRVIESLDSSVREN